MNNSCEKTCTTTTNTCHTRGGNAFIVLIVLYILLAIILGSRLY